MDISLFAVHWVSWEMASCPALFQERAFGAGIKPYHRYGGMSVSGADWNIGIEVGLVNPG
jgi:hypothetical protein